jgi:hypothetical protein
MSILYQHKFANKVIQITSVGSPIPLLPSSMRCFKWPSSDNGFRASASQNGDLLSNQKDELPTFFAGLLD